MKNETARREIESLDYYLQNHTNDYSEESHTAMMMAIKALEQPPCEDAVSRKAVEEMLQNGFPARGMWEIEGDVVKQTVCETLADALMELEKLPSVTPKRKTGKWVDRGEIMTLRWQCSECGRKDTQAYNFCPNCGADMRRGDADDED